MEVALIGPDNKIELKPITIGRNLGTEVEVFKGLTVGSAGQQSAGFARDRRPGSDRGKIPWSPQPRRSDFNEDVASARASQPR